MLKQGTRLLLGVACVTGACSAEPHAPAETEPRKKSAQGNEQLSIDPGTGIPFAYTFQHPVSGFQSTDYGFGFAFENRWFCMVRAPDESCIAYGIHLGRDTEVAGTPAGTKVRAPADGIVRITTDVRFGGYGSDDASNSAYGGCVVVLEHLLGSGEAVTTLLGHLECGSGLEVDTYVTRGEVVGRVGHYWHGAGTDVDWHHIHWGIRRGRFQAKKYQKSELLPYVRGYAPIAEFSVNQATGRLEHPDWIDPFALLSANGDASVSTDGEVRHHPPGSLLRDPNGTHWFVQDDVTIARVPSGVARNNRYATSDAIPVTDEEVRCYHRANDIVSDGLVTLYIRPGSNAVVMAYHDTKERYDLITWEAFLSWGFQEGDIAQGVQAETFEKEYRNRGFRLLRPGTLVKAHEDPEVSLITPQQTRRPIASEEAFERAGFKWNRIVSVPAAAIEEVAGRREDRVFTERDLLTCAVSSACMEEQSPCGGGGAAEEVQAGEQQSEEEEYTYESTSPAISTSEAAPQEPSSTPEPEPSSMPHPVLSSSLTIEVRTTQDMNDFSLWLLSEASYVTPEETGAACVVAERFAQCTVSQDGLQSFEFWMYTGVSETPWSPGLNWETDRCDAFADVSVWQGDKEISLQMVPFGDGCHFLVAGK